MCSLFSHKLLQEFTPCSFPGRISKGRLILTPICGFYNDTIPQLGTVQKEIEPLSVPREPNQIQVEFLREMGLTLEQAEGRTEDIPTAPVVNIPFNLEKPFVTEEEEINLGTQMFNLHRWYMRKSNDEGTMFEVKYCDQDFFPGEDDFWMDFQLVHAIYRQDVPSTSLSLPFGFCKYRLIYIYILIYFVDQHHRIFCALSNLYCIM